MIRRRRRRRRHIVMAVIVVLCLTNIAVGGGYAYLRWRLGQIDRVPVPGLIEDEGQTMNVLLVGSDSRARLTGEAAAQAGKGQVTGERTDTIMVVHIDPHSKRAVLLSIPRDLYLPIAGTNRSDRVNAAFGLGGAPALVATIQQGLGIQINHYAEVDFVGFKDIVDAIGKVTVYVPAPARDDFSGLELGTPGCVALDGEAALAWVRSRSYEYFSNGQWIKDPRSDLGRIQRQQDFMRRTVSKAVSSGLSNPITFDRIFGLVVNNLTVDSTMSTKDMTTLARRFRSLDPDSIETRTLPTTDTMINGAAVLLLNRDEAQADIDAINGKEPPAAATAVVAAAEAPTTVPHVAPSAIRTRVVNSTGTEGSATTASAALKAAGFTVVGAATGARAAATVIRYRPGAIARALVVEAALDSKVELQQDPTVKGADVVLDLGADDKKVKPGAASSGASPASTTTTTAPEPSPVPAGTPEKTC